MQLKEGWGLALISHGLSSLDAWGLAPEPCLVPPEPCRVGLL